MRALVFPIFLRGADTIFARERQNIDHYEMWCRWRMLKIPDCEAYQYIDPNPTSYTICQQRILSYYHKMRRGNETLEKLITVRNTEAKRSSGRSPTRWTDQVKDSSPSKLYTVIREELDKNHHQPSKPNITLDVHWTRIKTVTSKIRFSKGLPWRLSISAHSVCLGVASST
ncbi:unnamed protein product [Pieris macdunnoughi]|uniref:Uncharacterized protein n=1 Tax=Pieris macdunnoughi TaxID=345717 RepID=A0A821MIA0_9NEOP|nr:unnamed protein product [Pieris macdunnoughi]